MTSTLVHSVFCIDHFIFVVFYTEETCWQFRIMSLNGVVSGEQKLYYSAEAAEKAGREWLMWGN
jgi:hypothetical protein